LWIKKLSTKTPNGLNKNDWKHCNSSYVVLPVHVFIYLFIYMPITMWNFVKLSENLWKL
jgi:hypothetical protein